MTFIEYFGLVIKPKITKGRYMLSPIPNGEIMPRLYALRDKDVNAFLYEKDGYMVAVDCGYKNSAEIKNAMCSLGLDENNISALFLTHLDLDHAGGADRRCNRVFPNAQIYLGRIEEGYLTRKLYRKKLAFIGLKTPIALADGYRLLDGGQLVTIGSIKVKAILVPGHTMGHLCYLIDDKYLFVGDSLILVQGEGYAFYSLWNVNTTLDIQSLGELRNSTNAKVIITSHSGYTADSETAFAHVSEAPDWKRKGFKVSHDAPLDPYTTSS